MSETVDLWTETITAEPVMTNQTKTRKRIDALTDAERATFAPYAAEWIARGWRTGPMSDDEWASVQDAVRACYRYADLAEPKVIIRVPSPLVGAIAAPIASFLIELHKQQAVGGAVRKAVDDAVDDAVRDAVGGAVDDAVRKAVRDAVRKAVRGAVGDAVDDAVGDAVRGAVGDAVGDAVRGAVDDAVGDAVRGAVGGAVNDAVRDAVRKAVDDAVDDAVRDAVRGAVRDAVRGAVDDAVHDAVRKAVRGAVGDAVDDAVDGAVRKAIGQVLESGWYRRFSGQHWTGWMAWRLWFRDHGHLDLDGDLWDRAQAYADANVAGYWWAYRDFAMVADRPTVLHVEQIAPAGWGSHRLHREDGPAVAWADGTAVHSWHGTRVPADLIEGDGWDYERIMREPNSEIRRCAAERMGWPKFVDAGRLTLVDEAPDPGNAPHVLRLYDLPVRLYDEPVRLLLMTNGSPDRSGDLRQYGETVPGTIQTAIEAGAWQYGWPADAYKQLARRT